MKKTILFLFLLLMGLFGSLEAIASGGDMYTHTTPALELKPISSIENSYQTAAVCFLGVGDCQQGGFDKGDDDTIIDTSKQCQNEGYNLTSCTLPSFAHKLCPYDKTYFAECKIDKPRACNEAGYSNSCSSPQKLHSDQRCPWDSSYGKCCSPTNCPANTSLSGNYGNSGKTDNCGYACQYTCNPQCPSGTTENNPGGCGGSISNACGTKTCYYQYRSCCDSAYIYDSTNCIGTLAGSSCGGKYNYCFSSVTYVSESSCRSRCSSLGMGIPTPTLLRSLAQQILNAGNSECDVYWTTTSSYDSIWNTTWLRNDWACGSTAADISNYCLCIK